MSKVDSCIVFSLDIVDEDFNGVLIFHGVRRTTLGKDGVFKIGNFALEARFLWGVEVTTPVPGLASASSGPSLFINLGLIPHVDVLTFFVIMFRLLSSHSY